MLVSNLWHQNGCIHQTVSHALDMIWCDTINHCLFSGPLPSQQLQLGVLIFLEVAVTSLHFSLFPGKYSRSIYLRSPWGLKQGGHQMVEQGTEANLTATELEKEDIEPARWSRCCNLHQNTQIKWTFHQTPLVALSKVLLCWSMTLLTFWTPASCFPPTFGIQVKVTISG